MDGEPIGDLTLTAETKGTEMTVRAGGNIRESTVEASGKWRLEGDAPGRSHRQVLAHEYRFRARPGDARTRTRIVRREPPFEGFIDGGATVTLPLKKPEAFRAKVTLDTVQVNPRPTARCCGSACSSKT